MKMNPIKKFAGSRRQDAFCINAPRLPECRKKGGKDYRELRLTVAIHTKSF